MAINNRLASCIASVTVATVFLGAPVQAAPLVAQRPSQSPALINEAEVQKVIADVIKAAGDLKALDALLVKYVAPFVLTEFKAETSNQQISRVFEGRDELRAHMKEAYASIKKIEYIDKKVTTRFIENGKVMIADVSSLQRITTTGGRSYISKNLSTSAFAMVDGKLTVTSYISTAQIDRRP